METLEAIKRHKYAGIYNAPGDVYIAKRQHARALKALKLAKDYVAPPVVEVPIQKAEPIVEPVKVETKVEEAPKRRGRPPNYQRRDMVAE